MKVYLPLLGATISFGVASLHNSLLSIVWALIGMCWLGLAFLEARER